MSMHCLLQMTAMPAPLQHNMTCHLTKDKKTTYLPKVADTAFNVCKLHERATHQKVHIDTWL